MRRFVHRHAVRGRYGDCRGGKQKQQKESVYFIWRRFIRFCPCGTERIFAKIAKPALPDKNEKPFRGRDACHIFANFVA